MQNSHLLIWQVGVVIYYTHGCSNVNAKLFGEKLVVMNPFPGWYAYDRTNSAPNCHESIGNCMELHGEKV